MTITEFNEENWRLLMTAPTTHERAEQALREAAAERGALFLYGDFVAFRNEINAKLADTETICHAIMVSNYQRHVVGQFRDGEEGEIYEIILPETELASHEHAWPAELTPDATCENGCGLRYDQWQEPAIERIQREHDEQVAADAAEAARLEAMGLTHLNDIGYEDEHEDTPETS